MTLRAGVIGLGVMGRNHARSWGEVGGAELVAVDVADPDAAVITSRGRMLCGFLLAATVL